MFLDNLRENESHAIDYFHYDVICAKVSGSCSRDCAQGRLIAGKFKIIHKSTIAVAAESADQTVYNVHN